MDVDTLNENSIVACWHRNAVPWTAAVRNHQIESRRLVTDQAIVDAVLSRAPKEVVDIGCGEGWLCRELARVNIAVMGIDVIPSLVAQAQSAGGGEFCVASYEDIAAGTYKAWVDVVVCNFALFGKESVDGLFKSVPSLLRPGGAFIVQTLHPIACTDLPYQDGWREGSWAGFSSQFTDPAPWYFRTLESWKRIFEVNAMQLLELREPVNPNSGQPASVIFIAEPCRVPTAAPQ